MKYSLLFLCCCALFACNQNNSSIPAQDSGLSGSTDTLSPQKRLENEYQQFPDSVAILQNLVGFYLDRSQPAAAQSAVDKALKRDGGNPELWDLQSIVYTVKGDTAGAVRSLEKAIEIYPLPHYIISLGALYAAIKNPKALEMADALLIGNKAAADKEAWFIKGLYYNAINAQDKAIPCFDKALESDYHFMDAYTQKALAFYDTKRYEQAITVLQKAVALQNNFAEGYFQMGQCYEQIKDNEKAAESYRKAVLYDPAYTEAQEALAALKQ